MQSCSGGGDAAGWVAVSERTEPVMIDREPADSGYRWGGRIAASTITACLASILAAMELIAVSDAPRLGLAFDALPIAGALVAMLAIVRGDGWCVHAAAFAAGSAGGAALLVTLSLGLLPYIAAGMWMLLALALQQQAGIRGRTVWIAALWGVGAALVAGSLIALTL